MSTWITKRAKELGIPYFDAKAPLYLEVVANDIRTAVAKNPTCCAFANATKRGIPGVHRVYFYRSCAWIEYGDRLMRYLLPEECKRQIDRFDKTKSMVPGIYHLANPSKSTTLGAGRKRNKKKKHKRGVVKGTRAVVPVDKVTVTKLGKSKAATATTDNPLDVRSVNPAKWPAK